MIVPRNHKFVSLDTNYSLFTYLLSAQLSYISVEVAVSLRLNQLMKLNRVGIMKKKRSYVYLVAV